MILIVGLGNPGKKYEKTRHNIGFRIVDEIAANFQFSIFNFQSIFNAKISKGEIKKEKVILAKPQNFMNNSGYVVKKIISNLKCPISNLWIIHDDIDLPLAKIRISKNRGSAGHKGIESIIQELETKNFIRFRIGIRPLDDTFLMSIKKIDKFVLQNFNREEEKILKEGIKKTIEAIETAVTEGIERAMNKFNK